MEKKDKPILFLCQIQFRGLYHFITKLENYMKTKIIELPCEMTCPGVH